MNHTHSITCFCLLITNAVNLKMYLKYFHDATYYTYLFTINMFANTQHFKTTPFYEMLNRSPQQKTYAIYVQV